MNHGKKNYVKRRQFEKTGKCVLSEGLGARCSSVVRAFAHGAMGHRIDPSWWTIEPFLVPASAPRLV